MSVLPLTASELRQCRDVADQFLRGTAIILAQTLASDGQGGATATYTASGTVSARLAFESLRGDETDAAGRLAEVSPWVLTVPNGTAIDETGRVTYDSVTYEVVEVLTMVPEEISRRVRLKEVD